MRFAAIVAFPRFFRVYPSLPYPKEFFFLYARREICGAAHTSDDGGMCRKNGFFARKTSYFAFSTNALFRIRHFLTKSRKFPLSFFFVWQTGHTNQKSHPPRTRRYARTIRARSPARRRRPCAASASRRNRDVTHNAFFAVRTKYFAPRGQDTSRRAINKRAPFKENPPAEKRTD